MVERVNIDHIADDLSRAYQDGYNAGYADACAEKDVRPVVLCRDCKYYYKDADGYEMCDNSDGYDQVTEDGFCAWAVKMEATIREEESET